MIQGLISNAPLDTDTAAIVNAAEAEAAVGDANRAELLATNYVAGALPLSKDYVVADAATATTHKTTAETALANAEATYITAQADAGNYSALTGHL